MVVVTTVSYIVINAFATTNYFSSTDSPKHWMEYGMDEYLFFVLINISVIIASIIIEILCRIRIFSYKSIKYNLIVKNSFDMLFKGYLFKSYA